MLAQSRLVVFKLHFITEKYQYKCYSFKTSPKSQNLCFYLDKDSEKITLFTYECFPPKEAHDVQQACL
jgi:hypothetical protein